MDILHLTYFLEVAKYKSFTKASKTLHVSQPSISKAIRTLENEWDTILFHRNGRSIELTDAGIALLPQIESIIEQFHLLEEHIQDTHNLKGGQLALGIPPMIGSTFLSPILKDFLQKYPQIQIKVNESGSTLIAENILDGKLQCGFVALPLPSSINSNKLQTYIFNNEPLQIVMRADAPLANKPILTIADIKDSPLIFFTENFSLYYTILSYFQQNGYQPNIVAHSDNWDFISEMVKSGLGIGMLPMHICQRLDHREFATIPLEPALPWILALIWKDDPLLSMPTRLWIQHFKMKIKPNRNE